MSLKGGPRPHRHEQAPQGRCLAASLLLGQGESLVVCGSWRGAHARLLFNPEHAPPRPARDFSHQRYRRQSPSLCNCRSRSNRRLRRRFLSLSPLWTSPAGTMDFFRSPWACDYRCRPQLWPQKRSSGYRAVTTLRSLVRETFLPAPPSNGRDDFLHSKRRCGILAARFGCYDFYARIA